MRQPCTPGSRELGFADVPRFSFDKLSGREGHTNARGMLPSARLLETIDLPKSSDAACYVEEAIFEMSGLPSARKSLSARGAQHGSRLLRKERNKET